MKEKEREREREREREQVSMQHHLIASAKRGKDGDKNTTNYFMGS